MNNAVQMLTQMAMQRIMSNPQMQNNPQAREFMNIMQSGDQQRGIQMANNLCQSYNVTPQQMTQEAMRFFGIPNL